MKRFKGLLVLLFFTSFLVACGNKGPGTDKIAIEPEVIDLGGFKNKDISLAKDNLEELISYSQVGEKSSLSIVNIKDKNIYGVGYGPSGDGSKVSAFYKLGFNSKYKEEIDENNIINIFPSLIDRDNNIFYYIDYDAKENESEILKVNLESLESTSLARIKADIMDLLYIDGERVYYDEIDFSKDKTHIYSYDIKSKEVKEVTPKEVSESEEVLHLISYDINNENQYFVDYNISTEKSNTYQYNCRTNKLDKIYEDDQLDIVDLDGNLVLFQNNNKNKGMVWNNKEGYFQYEFNLAKDGKLIGFRDNNIVIDDQEANRINLIDLSASRKKTIDYSYLVSSLGDGEINWIFSQGDLYAQWIDAYNMDMDLKRDRIYRLKFK